MILANRYFEVENIRGLQILLCKFWKTPFEEVMQPCFDAFDAALRKFEIDSEITVIRPAPTFSRNSIETKIHTAEQTALGVLPLKWKGMSSIWTIALSNGMIYGSVPNWLRVLVESSDGNIEELLRSNSQKIGNLPQLKAEDIFLYLSWPGKIHTPSISQKPLPQFHRFSTLLTNQENEGRPFMSLDLKR